MKSKKSKLLHEIASKTLIERALAQVQAVKPDKIVLVLGHQKNEILNHLNSLETKYDIEVCDQLEALGTADAIQKAIPHLQDLPPSTEVFISAGDAVLLKQTTLKAFHDEHLKKKSQISLMSCVLDQPGAYGRIIRDSAGRVLKIQEAKVASEEELRVQEINSGFYFIQRANLEAGLSSIEKNSKSGEFFFTDIVEYFANRGALVLGLILGDATECLGVNTRADLALARRIHRDRLVAYWMSEGVSFDDPSSVWIDDEVSLAQDVEIQPGVILRASTKISSRAQIGAYSIVESSEIGEATKIEAHSVIEEASLGANCRVGPFARLRPGTRLDDSVKIGNFVETKKSHFQEGSKANHLSYVGDTEVGAASNVGAGTITCNYDGFHKYKTVLGKNVFIGSNTALVAPIKVGDNAIVGAGSTITKDVASDSIALTRADHKELKNAAKRFRERKQSPSAKSAGE